MTQQREEGRVNLVLLCSGDCVEFGEYESIRIEGLYDLHDHALATVRANMGEIKRLDLIREHGRPRAKPGGVKAWEAEMAIWNEARSERRYQIELIRTQTRDLICEAERVEFLEVNP